MQRHREDRRDGTGGGQHHQASAVISREAFLAAGDATKFPEQIREGLRAWQPGKFYYTGRFGFPGEPAPPEARGVGSFGKALMFTLATVVLAVLVIAGDLLI